MSLWQTQLNLSTLPINMTCSSDGRVGFSYNIPFPTIVDTWEGKQTIIDAHGIKVDDVDLNYGVWYNYKSMPILTSWLQSLKMEMPRFQ